MRHGLHRDVGDEEERHEGGECCKDEGPNHGAVQSHPEAHANRGAFFRAHASNVVGARPRIFSMASVFVAALPARTASNDAPTARANLSGAPFRFIPSMAASMGTSTHRSSCPSTRARIATWSAT